jgi:hypothetical protein
MIGIVSNITNCDTEFVKARWQQVLHPTRFLTKKLDDPTVYDAKPRW